MCKDQGEIILNTELEKRKEITCEFFESVLTEEGLEKIDYSSAEKVEQSFLNPDYHAFMYDITFQLRLEGKIAYFIVTFEFYEPKSNETTSQQLYDIIVDEVRESLLKWHNKYQPTDYEPAIMLLPQRWQANKKTCKNP